MKTPNNRRRHAPLLVLATINALLCLFAAGMAAAGGIDAPALF